MSLDTPMFSMIQTWRTGTYALAPPIILADEHFSVECLESAYVTL